MSADAEYTGRPATVELDALRLKIPDRCEPYLCTNTELQHFLDETGDVECAAIEALEFGAVVDQLEHDGGRQALALPLGLFGELPELAHADLLHE